MESIAVTATLIILIAACGVLLLFDNAFDAITEGVDTVVFGVAWALKGAAAVILFPFVVPYFAWITWREMKAERGRRE